MLAQASAARQKVPMKRARPAHLKAVCMFCDKEVYAQSVCRNHYQKAKRLKIPTSKLSELAGLAPKAKLEATVSPRLTEACFERLKAAVVKGRAESVYKLAANILEAWRDADEAAK